MESRHRVVVGLGQEPLIAGTGIPVRAVLGLTGLRRSSGEILEWSRSYANEVERPLDEADIRAAFAYAAELAGASRLSPPVRAAFARSKHVLGNLSVEEVEAKAPTILRALGTGVSEREMRKEDPDVSNELVGAIAAYAAKLVADRHMHAYSLVLGKESALGSRLTADDRGLLEAFYAYRRALGGPDNLSPDLLLGRWTRLVETVEGGYRDVYDEYANDLDGRDILEDTISMVSPPSRGALREIVDPLDNRFYGATRLTNRAVYPAREWKPLRWWWYRVPRKAGAAMQRHLEQVGVL
jgi:uncharacterized protein (DUF433 family)